MRQHQLTNLIRTGHWYSLKCPWKSVRSPCSPDLNSAATQLHPASNPETIPVPVSTVSVALVFGVFSVVQQLAIGARRGSIVPEIVSVDVSELPGGPDQDQILPRIGETRMALAGVLLMSMPSAGMRTRQTAAGQRCAGCWEVECRVPAAWRCRCRQGSEAGQRPVRPGCGRTPGDRHQC